MAKARRLTKAIMDEIVRSVLSECFDTRQEDLKIQEHSLALKVREKFLGKHREMFDSLPAELLTRNSEDKRIFVAANAHNHILHIPDECELIVPPRLCYWGSGYVVKGVLGDKITKHANDTEDLKDEMREMNNKIRAVLNSVTTVKRLIEVWPEVESHIPEQAETTGVPMVLISDLNQALEGARDVKLAA